MALPTTSPAPSILATLVTPIIHLPTPTAYDNYDHDGNVLQLRDDAYITTHALPLLSSILTTNPPHTPPQHPRPWLRHRQKYSKTPLIKPLLRPLHHRDRRKLWNARCGANPVTRELQHDILTTPSPPPQVAGCTPVVISTLVLEHLPLEFFFRFISSCLPPLPERGYVVLSNMHSEMGMGAISQAGFHAEEEGGTRINIRAEAMYNHTVREIVEGASSVAELEVMGEVSEIGVEERNVERLGGVASGWGRSCWWG